MWEKSAVKYSVFHRKQETISVRNVVLCKEGNIPLNAPWANRSTPRLERQYLHHLVQLSGNPTCEQDFCDGNNGMSFIQRRRRRRHVLRDDIPECWSLPSSWWDQEAPGQEISSRHSPTGPAVPLHPDHISPAGTGHISPQHRPGNVWEPKIVLYQINTPES